MFNDLSKYDVFNTYLLHDAEYAGELEMPILHGVDAVPKELIPFSKAIARKFTRRNCWVCFYEHDIKFIRFWRHPEKYMERLLEFEGIISPDFSMYRNMPTIMQFWSCFKSRALAHRYEADGGNLIPNIRLSDRRSHKPCLAGLPKNKTIAIGTHGCLKNLDDRKHTKENLEITLETLTPIRLLIYGAAPDDIFTPEIRHSVEVVTYQSLFSATHQKKVQNGNR